MNRALSKRYHISPCIFSLACIFLTLLLLADVITLYFWVSNTWGMTFAEARHNSYLMSFAFEFVLTLIVLIIYLHNAYEYFGTVEIFPDRLVFRAPFRRVRVFLYVDIRDIGIDYGKILGSQQLWIYFSKNTLSVAYTHNILRLPFSRKAMRVQYRKEIYNTLMDSLPYKPLGKRLNQSYSVVRMFFQDEH